MAGFNYYLGPWIWDTSNRNDPHYRAPEGTIGLIDLRPNSPVETYGFFATDRKLGPDYTSYGDGVNRLEDIALSPAQRTKWSSQLGIGAVTETRLKDVLVETLMMRGDPDGGLICPPLMPTHKGILEVHLGGHSVIHSERFTGVDHRAWPLIQAVVQRNYHAVKMRKTTDPLLHSKYLDSMNRKLGLRGEQWNSSMHGMTASANSSKLNTFELLGVISLLRVGWRSNWTAPPYDNIHANRTTRRTPRL